MILKLLTLALTALIVIPAGAHLFELPAKIGMAEADYFTVQTIYAGWALFAVAIVAAIAANGYLSWTLRRTERTAALSALAAALLICLTLVIFLVWVFPGNQATANWTSIPSNWENLRRNWEYGHAMNAIITFVALLATGRAIIGATPTPIGNGAARSETGVMIHHVSLGTNNVERSKRFYDAALPIVGIVRMAEDKGGLGYGCGTFHFSVQLPIDGQPATVGNGTHIAFAVENRSMVDRFYVTALANGGRDDGPLGLRPVYDPHYYGAFVRDPDGHKIEAVTYSAN